MFSSNKFEYPIKYKKKGLNLLVSNNYKKLL